MVCVCNIHMKEVCLRETLRWEVPIEKQHETATIGTFVLAEWAKLPVKWHTKLEVSPDHVATPHGMSM